MNLLAELEFAQKLADAADRVTLAGFKARDLVVDTKPDLTPVSEADRQVEELLRKRISAERPDHEILGEEFGVSGAGEWLWVIDPIDATMNYVRGIPVFATLIALTRFGRTEVGVVTAPALGRRWWAARGHGAFLNGDPITVSGVTRLEDAQLSVNSLLDFSDHGFWEGGLALSERCWRTRGFGDFWSHMLVAEGAVDIAAEPIVAAWDLAALQVIVEEAGGRFTDFSGEATFEGGNVVTSNGLLHEETLGLLHGRGVKSAGRQRPKPKT
ncbi:MAG TPA: inositol monophosphatase family protein [Acidimicrobiia bacterium]|nr:inositol monophosphatase family protein [Acidimicrobiia bacterium]